MLLEKLTTNEKPQGNYYPHQQDSVDFRKAIDMDEKTQHPLPLASLSEAWTDIISRVPSNKLFSISIQVVIAVAVASCVARACVLLVSHNYNLAAEANGLYGLLEVADGRELYPASGANPYHVYLYGPAHGMSLGMIFRWTATEKLRARVILVRLTSLVLFIGTLLILWRYWYFQSGISGSVYALALALGLSKFADYVTTSRNDCMSLFFEILALTLFAKWDKEKKKGYFIAFIVIGVLSFYTRFTSVAAIITVWCFLLYRRRWVEFLTLSLSFMLLVSVIFWWLNSQTNGAFFEHSVLANVRSFRPLDRTFFDFSFLSFSASYALYVALLALGLFQKDPKTEQDGLLKTSFFVSFLIALSTFLRAGGDVNYFFECILIGSFFCARGIHRILAHIPGKGSKILSRRAFYMLVMGQLLIVVFVCSSKAYSAWRTAFLPFESAAQRIREALPPFVFVSGTYGANLIIHLRPLAYHGPDVTTLSFIARNAHPRLRWIFRDLDQALNDGRVRWVIVAEEGCARHLRPNLESPLGERFIRFEKRERWADWLCVHTSG